MFSLHLTVAIPTSDLSLSTTLLHAVRAVCFGERAFRQALPLGPLPKHVPSPTGSQPDRHQCVPSLTIHASSSTRICVRLRFGAQPGHAAAEATAQMVWRRQHALLWERVHAGVSLAQMRDELNRRMGVQRRRQRQAFAASNGAYQQAQRDGGAVALRPGNRLIKLVALELITPSPEWPAEDWRRIAQAMPVAGGPGRQAFFHAPAEMYTPLAAFAAWPLEHVFSLEQLPARDAFTRACVARSLFGLGVVMFVADYYYAVLCREKGAQ